MKARSWSAETRCGSAVTEHPDGATCAGRTCHSSPGEDEGENGCRLGGERRAGAPATPPAMYAPARVKLSPDLPVALDDLPIALRYAQDRVDDAIKVVVKTRGQEAVRQAAE